MRGWRTIVPFVCAIPRTLGAGSMLLVGVLVEVGAFKASPLFTSKVFDHLVYLDRDGFFRVLLLAGGIAVAALVASVGSSWFSVNFEERAACSMRRRGSAGR